MKKIDPGQIAQWLANIGVIAGIVFLGIEIQQNTRSVEVSAYQELVGQINAFATMNIANPELDFKARSDVSLADLDESDRSRVISYYYFVARHGDLAHYQYIRGMLSAERLESSMGPLNDRVCTPLFGEFWESASYNFTGEYREYIDAKFAAC
jgi:hypothetical protein